MWKLHCSQWRAPAEMFWMCWRILEAIPKVSWLFVFDINKSIIYRQNRQHSSAISHISNSSPPTRKRSIDGGYTSGTDSANTSEIVIKKRLTFSKKSHSTSEIETWNAHLQVDYHLETVTPSCSTVYQKITSETLIEIMQKLSQIEFMQKYILIDCRYDYEYNGGHIKVSFCRLYYVSRLQSLSVYL